MRQTCAVKRRNHQTNVHSVYFCPGSLSRWSKFFGRKVNSSNVFVSGLQQRCEDKVIKNNIGLMQNKLLHQSQYIASFGENRTSKKGLSKIFLDICTACLWRCDKNNISCAYITQHVHNQKCTPVIRIWINCKSYSNKASFNVYRKLQIAFDFSKSTPPKKVYASSLWESGRNFCE